MSNYDYLIVGAGLYGSVFASMATKNSKRCLVIEKRPHVAGNIFTENIEGINVHKYGAHIFHTCDKKIWDFINTYSEFNRYTNSPIANFKGIVYNLPFNMNTFNRLWGVVTPEQALQKIEEQKLKLSHAPKNLEEQALSLVGKDIYEALIKGYTEKQWGAKATQLPAFIIERLPVRFTYDNNYFNDPYQGIPVGGYTQIVEKLLCGTTVQLNTDFFSNREYFTSLAKKVVFTGMMDEFFDYKLGRLEYRGLEFNTKTLYTTNFQGNAVVNYTEYDVPYTRIIEHKHFEFGQQEKTVVTYEYPANCNHGAEPYYPVNSEKNNQLFADYLAVAAKHESVLFGGRLGSYKYFDMDDVIAAALQDAEKEFG